nr:c-type cytochrome [Rhizomicrobium palustre]
MKAAALAAMFVLCGGAAAPSDPPPKWAFAGMKPGPELAKDKLFSAPGSTLKVPGGKFADSAFIADWFPADHTPMPAVVGQGRKEKKLQPCALCHLATGAGGPDSAPLAGLSADYIVAQVEEFRSGRRACAGDCAKEMAGIAAALSPADLREAAAYFARQPYRSRMVVQEAAMVPKAELVWFAYMPVKGAGLEPIGARVLEMPADLNRYLMGDWRLPVTVYVPPGSIARGKTLARGGAGVMACAACHGADLKGAGSAPPLAGRSPSYLYRQLYNIQYGFRKGPAVAQMQPVVAHLNAKDRIALAAYLASVKN